jgi:hypothetical protein
MQLREFKNRVIMTALSVICAWFAGCATHGYMTVTHETDPIRAVASPSAVKVLPDALMPQEPFDVIGQVTISLVPGMGPKPVEYKKDEHMHTACIEKMKEEAAAMGGNALAGIYYYHPDSYDAPVKNKMPSFMSALVVKTLENGQTPTHPQGDFVVGVTMADPEDTDPARQIFARKWSCRYAQIQLAQKGYYILPEPQDLTGRDFSSLSRAEPDEIAPLGGQSAGLILGLEREGRHRTFVLLPGILGTGEKDKMAAAFFSKTARKVTWSDSATGFAATGWIISMFAPRAKEAMALNAAITKMLAGAPVVATKTLDVKYDGNQIRPR